MNTDLLIKILNESELAIIPTDTTYGIICDATNDYAVKKVFLAKKRDFSKPLIILASDINMLKKYTKEINILEEKIIEKFLPGKLSILLLKNELVSDLVTASSPYVAVRIPDDKNLRDFISLFGKPIVATSANITGKDTITNISEIEKELFEKVKYVYDGGTIKCNPSTLIKVENNKIIFLREGDIAKDIKREFYEYIK